MPWREYHLNNAFLVYVKLFEHDGVNNIHTHNITRTLYNAMCHHNQESKEVKNNPLFFSACSMVRFLPIALIIK